MHSFFPDLKFLQTSLRNSSKYKQPNFKSVLLGMLSRKVSSVTEIQESQYNSSKCEKVPILKYERVWTLKKDTQLHQTIFDCKWLTQDHTVIVFKNKNPDYQILVYYFILHQEAQKLPSPNTYFKKAAFLPARKYPTAYLSAF